jgi:hypothetical protein
MINPEPRGLRPVLVLKFVIDERYLYRCRPKHAFYAGYCFCEERKEPSRSWPLCRETIIWCATS